MFPNQYPVCSLIVPFRSPNCSLIHVVISMLKTCKERNLWFYLFPNQFPVCSFIVPLLFSFGSQFVLYLFLKCYLMVLCLFPYFMGDKFIIILDFPRDKQISITKQVIGHMIGSNKEQYLGHYVLLCS